MLDRRLLPLVGLLLLAATLRTAVTAISPILGPLRTGAGVSDAQASLLGSLAPACFAVGGLAGATVIRALGLERVAWVAMGLAAAGQAGRALLPGAFLPFTVVALLGLGLGNVVAPPLVKRYFPDRVAQVTGAYVVLLQVGTAAAAQSAPALEQDGGWRLPLLVWAGFSAVAAVPWLLMHRRSLGADRPRTATLSMRRTAASPLAWGMTVLFGVQSLTAYAIMAWLPTIYRDAGQSQQVGASALGLFSLLQIPMSLAAPVLVARLRRPVLLLTGFVTCNLVAYAGLAYAPTWHPLVWSVLLGLGAGSFAVALALIGLRAQTPAGAAALSSFAQGLGYVIAVTGPAVCGVLRHHTGSWRPSLLLLAVLMAVLLAGGVVATRPRTLEEDLGLVDAPATGVVTDR